MILLLDRSIIVGTFPECGLRVHDPYASGFHAKLTETEFGFTVEDLGSTNGTYVLDAGGALIRVYGSLKLQKGDRIKVGRTLLPWTVDK